MLILTVKFIINSEFKKCPPPLMKLLTRLKPLLSPFFEGFNFSACLDTVGYCVHIFVLDLTGVFCLEELMFNSVIPFSFF
jgi:hypothetical protein